MATDLQKAAVAKLSENIGKGVIIPKGELLREVGYSEQTSLSPKLVTESKGFKEELAKHGLTEELITLALVDDIKAKPKQRVKELSLAADILGMKKSTEAGGNKTLILTITGESANRYGAKATNIPSVPESSSE